MIKALIESLLKSLRLVEKKIDKTGKGSAIKAKDSKNKALELIESHQKNINQLVHQYSKKLKYSGLDDYDYKAYIKELFPEADSETCPHCKNIFDRVVKRARNCDQCNKKVVVRQGFVLTENQADQLQEQIELRFRYKSSISDLRDNIKVSDALFDGDYLRALFEIGNAYKALEQYDMGWSVLNRDVFEVKRLTNDDIGRIYEERLGFLRDEAYDKNKISKKDMIKIINTAFVFIVNLANNISDDQYWVNSHLINLILDCDTLRLNAKIPKRELIIMFDQFCTQNKVKNRNQLRKFVIEQIKGL